MKVIHHIPLDIFLSIAGPIVVLLTIATLVNFIASKLKPGNGTFKKVRVIIRSWWLIIGTVLAAGFFGAKGMLLLFTTIILFSLREYLRVSLIPDEKLKGKILFYLYFGVIIQFLLIYYKNFEYFASFPVLYTLLSLPLILFHPHASKDFTRVFSGYLGALLFSHFLLYIPALMFIGPEEKALKLIFIIIALTQSNDILQFICGKCFGRRKPVPHLSPNKTEAGFIGGILLTTIIGGFVLKAAIGVGSPLAFTLACSISIFGIFGDLLFSSIKRHIGVKDFSSALPGHGGLIDRLDSLIFTAPVAFHVVTFFIARQ